MSGDSGEGVVAGVLTMGVIYWLVYACAMAALAAVVGLIVLAAVVVAALVGAGMSLKRSRAKAVEDDAWRRDLLMAPLSAILVAAILAPLFSNWMLSLKSDNQIPVAVGAWLIWAYFVAPFVAFRTVGSEHANVRLWAYPAFASAIVTWGAYALYALQK